MARLEYAAEDHERFKACALALKGCNAIGQRILTQSGVLAPRHGSLAERDLNELRARDPTPPADVLDIVIAGTVGPHVYAACEHLGALSVLYLFEEIHVAPMVLARTVVEHCAHAIWILGSKSDLAEARLARAVVDYLNGLKQAEKYAREFVGEGRPGHLAKQALTTEGSDFMSKDPVAARDLRGTSSLSGRFRSFRPESGPLIRTSLT